MKIETGVAFVSLDPHHHLLILWRLQQKYLSQRFTLQKQESLSSKLEINCMSNSGVPKGGR